MTHNELALLEDQRLQMQAALDAAKSKVERNRQGQFATPPLLATSILERARRFFSPHQPIRFLDPAFGTGAFYSALFRVFPDDQISVARGYELDPHYGKPATLLWGDQRTEIVIGDFTKADPPLQDSDKFNLVICNPPYVRHHHLKAIEKKRLQAKAAQLTNTVYSGLAGLHVYFLAIAHAWLQDGGIAGWLIPSEFMDVNYGAAIREYLTSEVTLLNIHRFESQDVQFDDALVSSVIVWFRKQKPQPDNSAIFSLGGSLDHPTIYQAVSLKDLKEEAKWTRFPVHKVRTSEDAVLRFRDLFEIKRGIATGANDFFIVNRQQIERYALPAAFLTPILPSPRYLENDEVIGDENGHPLLQRALFLVDCDLPEDKVAQQYPTLWHYLQQGKERGVHQGYLCKHRTLWYAQDKRKPSPFLCTYMGRPSNGHTTNPFRFILNHSRAVAPNVYLNIYPNRLLGQALAQKPELKYVVWHALQAISVESLIAEGRIYGGGLHKLEPSELANLPIDAAFGWEELLATIPRQETLL